MAEREMVMKNEKFWINKKSLYTRIIKEAAKLPW